jgi:predicted PhzF superfamily epimerase YddE/YHI9
MPIHKPKYNPETYHPQQSYSAKQLSRYDMQVAGVVVFVVAMTVFFVVALVMMLFGGEAATQAHAQTTKVEHHSVSAGERNKLAELTQPLPKPASRAEDVNDDISALHAHEDLLLENYTWADRSQAKVRIPIERSMVLVAQRGLPTAPAANNAPLMTGDSKQAVAAPLTNGFARTEDEQARTQARR